MSAAVEDDSRLTTRNPLGEDAVEATIRPSALQEFVGQRKAKENLSVFIEAARSRCEALDHTLLYGPPGLGKTTIASIIARELGVNFRVTSGPLLSKAGDLASILTNLQAHDVLFIDEIHRMNTTVEEVLYPALEDFHLDIIIGEGPSARSVRIDLPPFTLVGATTRLGLLSNPLRDRFGIPTRLNFYDADELETILIRASGIFNAGLTQEGANEVAMRSRGTPRIALRLLRRIRDFAAVAGASEISRELAQHALGKLDVDAKGLDGADHRYLRYIADKYHGGPVGIDTIAAGLSEQRDSIEETIEPYLLQIGFIQRTPRGRTLTESAFAHLGIKPLKTELFQTDLLFQPESETTDA